jgi:hypothetical protein
MTNHLVNQQRNIDFKVVNVEMKIANQAAKLQ